MYKIGIDIVKISRMENSIKSSSFMKKVFTQCEKEYCTRSESFAGIFAAKEAYFKALGDGIKLPLTEIEVLHDDKGKPYLNGIDNSDLSISHDGEYAVATVILW
ncbi:MAG: holo-ACP synthase [Acetobacter sp.]|nr:holo-ACP synthase [Bacteroides sp.]MCM1342152.1 holo-ACP synthase [Acetobacter sp.]MCM1434380.1 holo-ACP synthase [Clostridiales bacterium]